MQNFDKILWRINGFIILLFASLGILFLSFLLFGTFMDKTRDREVTNIVNNSEIKKDEYLYLGDFENIRGTKFFTSPLFLSQKYDRSYYEKTTSSIKNYLFFNVLDNSKKWLFKDNSRLIISKREFLQDISIINSPILGFIFTVIEKDTNSDNILNFKDDKSIYISYINGKSVKNILKGVKTILGIRQYENDKVVIFHYLKSGVYALKINLNNFEIIENSTIERSLKNEKSFNTE